MPVESEPRKISEYDLHKLARLIREANQASIPRARDYRGHEIWSTSKVLQDYLAHLARKYNIDFATHVISINGHITPLKDDSK